ncbi:NRDE family protein [Rasiella sp. SM2506]|uniref:NRDE family protein n=1 Tax=Rasiella sp. SM2506 TaxID=3423914 RepID=UPI003D79E04B
MCTVTFIPKNNNDFILTSNRDEAPGRNTMEPQKYTVDGTQLLFPKDAVAGGTWIGLSEKKRLICLLNGGVTAHERATEYRMSRGIIVTKFLTAENVIETILAFDFSGIEPFTILLVLFEAETQLYELIWDGENPQFSEKPLQPHIWSSSLLYTEEMKQLRNEWFSEFMFETLKPTSEEILKFHSEAGAGSKESDLIMDRNFVKTKSITQIHKAEEDVSMYYQDLQTKQQTVTLL